MNRFDLLAAFAFLLPSLLPGQPPDLIIHNAIVWTVDERYPVAEAVAIRSGKIIAVGSDENIIKLSGQGTEILDVKKALVVPGFNDNHVHFASAAQFLEFNIMAVGTQEEFLRRVKDVASALAKGEWILGGYWGAYDQWAAASTGGRSRTPFVPDMKAVEELTKDHPMFIRKFDDSEFAANSAALRAAGLDPVKPAADGVEFLYHSDGAFAGIMRGTGVLKLFREIVPRKFSRERRIHQTKNALAEMRKYGVTNVSDMSDDEQLEIYRELLEKGELTARIHFRYGLDRRKELADKGTTVGSGDPWIRLGSLKGHIDGIMGTSTARFFEPYSNNPNNRGRWRALMVDEQGNFLEGKFLKYMLEADNDNLQMSVHAIGDQANNVLLNYLEELNKQNGKKDRRFRLVHAQVIAPKDFQRLGALGVIAEVQPVHLSDDMRWMEERIGNERCKGAYAFKSILKSGAMLSFGTDWPGTSAAEYPINPLLGLYAAVTRQTLDGLPADGWFPEERIDIKEAIKAYTYNSAYANFEEKEKGSISVGKLADITVLSKNLLKVDPKEMLQAEILYTIVDGKVVYTKP
ncbi:MAG: amidohydrolase [Ignavibacteriales bacterium]|nr:amidohydrolase [Ignavibacteriales bacterium]